MQAISELLASPFVSSLLLTHPNDVHPSAIPPSWHRWWEWAASLSTVPHWVGLIQYYISNKAEIPLPEDIQRLLDNVRHLQLPRNPVPFTSIPAGRYSLAGMSPKKVHEVVRMTSYVKHLLAANSRLRNIRHVVDIGAGQVRAIRGAMRTVPFR